MGATGIEWGNGWRTDFYVCFSYKYFPWFFYDVVKIRTSLTTVSARDGNAIQEEETLVSKVRLKTAQGFISLLRD